MYNINVQKIGDKMKKRKINKFNIYTSIISILLIWLALTIIILLAKYNILPLKYFLPLVLFLILYPGFLVYKMIRKKTKKKTKIIISILSTISSIVLSIILIYLGKTFNFLDNFGEVGYALENYSVIVLNNDKYNELNDLNEKTMTYFKTEGQNIEEALENLDKEINTKKQEEENLEKIIEKLYTEETDAIILEDSTIGIIEENNKDFEEKTKTIYKIQVKKNTENTAKTVKVNRENFNIYITGIDTYGDISAVSRSDVNIVASVNPNTHQVLLISIPRDYYVQLADTTGYKDKITHAGIYGIEKQVKTVENLLDIDINYYIKVNFSSLEQIVDALGSVEVYSMYSFNGYDGTVFQEGYNRVNGRQALDFARTRKTVSGGDRTRGQNQQALIQAIINKACSKEIITRYTNILNSLEGSFQTNMTTDEITTIIKKQIDEMAKWTVTSISLDGSDGHEYTYSYSGSPLYVMIPDEETIELAKQKISAVLNGEILEGSYQENSGNVNIPTSTTPQWMLEDWSQPEEPQPEEKPEEKPEEIEKEEQENEGIKDLETTENDETEQETEQNEEETTETENEEEQENEIIEDPETNESEETEAENS